MNSITLTSIILVSIIGFSDEACFRVRPTVNTNSLGTTEVSCIYKGLSFASNSTFKLASPECVTCTCTDTGLNCCGYGAMAGTMSVKGCKRASDFCNVRFVDENDPNQPCPAFTKATITTTTTTTTTAPDEEETTGEDY
ncbi:unnamed protein product [Adineta ricciae]|uniref:Uncharacterized protein n=1 Tax=Adineta ricciae TaxID=249248 RepID=A0A815HTY8_ADIRI|nr:unnamed protein product [Adineta ricciae]CAF1587627.1 unnamed protein product [Adineta ricciae]